MGFFSAPGRRPRDRARKGRFRWPLAVLGGLLAPLSLAVLALSLRSPVILVEDQPFSALYGPRRAWSRQVELSLRFFRPFRTVLAGENAGADMVVFAVEEKAKSPHAVLFPYRYYEGARRYAEKHADVPVLVFGGRDVSAPAAGGGTAFIGTDSLTDYYRAGLAAAVFLRKRPGRLVFYQHGSFPAAGREAFLRGLREGEGPEDAPLFLTGDAEFDRWQEASCVVLTGPAPNFLERNPEVPVILFSWIDPALTPSAVRVIFDDSPWALAARALKTMGEGGEGGAFASDMAVFPERIGDREMVQALQKTAEKTL